MKFKRENKGFSLVELIVVIAIFSVIGVAVGGFMMAASRSYAVNANELNLQEEAQLVANQMQEMILDTAYGISYQYVVTDDTGTNLIDYMESDAAVLPAGDLSKKDLYIYGKNQYYHLSWDKATGKLYLEEFEKNAAGDYVLVAGMPTNGVLLGEYIADFQVDLSKVSSDRMVGFNIKFKKPASDREYLVTRTVSLRNDVMTNKTANEVYIAVGEEFQPAADNLSVTPNTTIAMWPGDLQQYRVVLTCSRGGVPSQAVSWTIESTDGTELSADTRINNANLLQIGADEKSKQLVLNVSANGYDFENNKEVTLTHAPLYVNMRKITGLTIASDTFTEQVVQGGEYKISVKLEGENLPATVTDAGGIQAYVKSGTGYVTIEQTDVSGLTAFYTVNVSKNAPAGQQFELEFRAAKEGYTHVVETLKMPEVADAAKEILEIKKTDGLTEWLRLGNSKVKVDFKEEKDKKSYTTTTGDWYYKKTELNKDYYIRYKYEFRDAKGNVLKTATSTVGKDTTTASTTLADYLASVSYSDSFNATAKMSEVVPLTSGEVVVTAELLRNKDNVLAVIGTSNAVTYNIPQVTLAYKRAQSAESRTDLVAYVTAANNKKDDDYDDYPSKDNNIANIYVEYKYGFEKGTNPKIDLSKFVIESGSDYGSLTSEASKNMLKVTAKGDVSYSKDNTIVVKHTELNSSFKVVLKKTNISTGTYTYYIPFDNTKWDAVSDIKGYDYVYYINDDIRMVIDVKTKDHSQLSTKGGVVQVYSNKNWQDRRTYIVYSDNYWKSSY